ncbi:MAG: FG-GAP-like repeat-containing protein [Verrucomicrobiales bacterium]|nr:FG-GAP-like repeat-containing protein [Verrucomicrobiales bacterium]
MKYPKIAFCFLNLSLTLISVINARGQAGYLADAQTSTSIDPEQSVTTNRLYLTVGVLAPVNTTVWFVADRAADGVPTNPLANQILGPDDLLIRSDVVDGTLLGNQAGKYFRNAIEVSDVVATNAVIYFYLWNGQGASFQPQPGSTFGLFQVGIAPPPPVGNAKWLIVTDVLADQHQVGAPAAGVPLITLAPTNQTVNVGASATFTVQASGTAPLLYQWRKGLATIPGATSSTLTLNAVAVADSGTYSVIVSNTVGTATSQGAVLTVNEGPPPPPGNTTPTISAIPDQIVNTGKPAGPIVFTIGDDATPPEALQVTGTSSDQTIAPNGNFFFEGTGPTRSLTIQPASTTTKGTIDVSIRVEDAGGAATTNKFRVTFDSDAGFPLLAPISSPQTVQEDQSLVTNILIGDGKGGVEGLTVSGKSSNTNLVPNTNISFQGTGATRALTVQPAFNQFGSTVITITVTKGANSISKEFTLNVSEVNDPPGIGPISDQTIAQSRTSDLIPFTVSDAETAPSDLLVALLSSSDQSVIPESGVVFGGAGGNRTMKITPVPDRFGKSVLTLRVTDTGRPSDHTNPQHTDFSFIVLVAPVNSPPTINLVADLTIPEDAGPVAVPLIGITAGRPSEEDQKLTLTASSSNLDLIPEPVVAYTSPAATGTVTLTPSTNQFGESVITLILTDNGATLNGGGNATTNRFKVTVAPVNDSPVLFPPPAQSTPKGIFLTVPFTVSDVETPPDQIVVVAKSSDQTKVADADLAVSQISTNRTVIIRPQAEQVGTVTITLEATDKGGPAGQNPLIATANFSLTLRDEIPNLRPTIEPIANLSSPEDTIVQTTFVISDEDVNTVNFSATSDNAELLPGDSIVFGGSGANRSMIMIPAKDKSGVVNVSVIARDGSQDAPLTATAQFQLTVTPEEDEPTILLRGSANRTFEEDTPLGASDAVSDVLELTVRDAETPADKLALEITSSNPELLQADNVVVSTNGELRRLVITPRADQHGRATLVLRAVDEAGRSAATELNLTVTEVNDPPSINPVADVTIEEGAPIQTVPLSGITAGAPNENQAISITAATDNPDLLSNLALNYTSPKSVASLTFLPAPNRGGSGQVTLVIADDLGAQLTNHFRVTIREFNDPPFLSEIAPQFTPENTATMVIPFTVSDPETAGERLVLSLFSSDALVVPNGSWSFGGSGSERGLVIKPGENQIGQTTITVTVTDLGGAGGSDAKSTSQTFKLTVATTPGAPRISILPDLTTELNGESDVVSFTVTDDQTPASEIVLTARSTKPELVPDDHIQFSGNGAERFLVVIPARDQFGTADIILEARDADGNIGSRSFKFTVKKPQSPPAISTIPDQTLRQDRVTAALPFTVSDKETASGFLVVNATSSKQALVPDANITLSGTGQNRSVRVTPVSGLSGQTTITISVSDADGESATTHFLITFESNNTEPIISSLADQSSFEGEAIDVLPITIGDLETAPEFLRLTAASSNESLVPTQNIFFGGRGANRTVFVRPVLGQLGIAEMTIYVWDAAGKSASTSFRLTITSKPNATPGDFNNDGTPDLIFQDAAGALAVWLMQGAELINAAPFEVPSLDPVWRVFGVADFDGDGRPDLGLQNDDGSLAAWIMDGLRFNRGLSFDPPRLSRNWRAVSLVDFNEDDRADVLFQHVDGSLAIWYMDGVKQVSTTLVNPSDPGLGWQAVASAHFNADDQPDIIFQHTDGALRVWFMDGASLRLATMLNPSGPSGPLWRLAACTDLDRDGSTDLIFQHEQERTLAVWFMNGIDLREAGSLSPSDPGGTWSLFGHQGKIAPPVTSAKFDRIQRLPNGSFEISFSAPQGASITIEGSTDLKEWTLLSLITNSTGAVTYTVPGDGDARFLRAKVAGQ